MFKKITVFRSCRLRRQGQTNTLFWKICGFVALVPLASKQTLGKQTMPDRTSNPPEFIWFDDIDGPKPYNLIGFGTIDASARYPPPCRLARSGVLYLPTKGVYPFTGDPQTRCAKHNENP